MVLLSTYQPATHFNENSTDAAFPLKVPTPNIFCIVELNESDAKLDRLSLGPFSFARATFRMVSGSEKIMV